MVYSRWIFSVKSVPEGFPVVASSSLRPSTFLASEGSVLTWVPMKSEFISTYAHSVQLVRLLLRPRMALILQVMIDRTC